MTEFCRKLQYDKMSGFFLKIEEILLKNWEIKWKKFCKQVENFWNKDKDDFFFNEILKNIEEILVKSLEIFQKNEEILRKVEEILAENWETMRIFILHLQLSSMWKNWTKK